MNLKNVKYWKNGEQITQNDLNNILLSLSILDNKIVDIPKVSNTGIQYNVTLEYTSIDNAVYNTDSNLSTISFTPSSSSNVLGLLSVSDGNTSYTNIDYNLNSNLITVYDADLSNKTIYISYFATFSTVEFSDIITNIDISTQYFPFVTILKYENNKIFSVYVKSLTSQYTKYGDWTKIGNVYLDTTQTEFKLEDTNVTITLNSYNILDSKNINIGDTIYFTVLYPEIQIFGNSIQIKGNLSVDEDILPSSLNSNIGTLGSQTYDFESGYFSGIFTKQFNNIIGKHIYSNILYTTNIITNQIGNITDKKLNYNPITGEFYSDNKDIYIKLDEYDLTSNNGVLVSVGVHPNNSYVLDITKLNTEITLDNLLNNSILVENNRLGYLTNLQNVGDIIYINKKQIFQYLQSINVLITFSTTSLEHQKISTQYIDSSTNTVNDINIIQKSYIDTVVINNVEYLKYSIVNNTKTSLFQTGSVNNISKINNIKFGTYIVNLDNLNDNEENIVVNGVSNGNAVLAYKYNSDQRLFDLSIQDYSEGEVILTPYTTDLDSIYNLLQLTYSYNQYKLSVKNDKLSIQTKDGNVIVDNTLHFEKNKVTQPFLTYLNSGILNFNGTTKTQSIDISGLTSDVEVLLIPLYWQYINNIDPTSIYSMYLNYEKSGNNLNISFYSIKQGTQTSSSQTIDVNKTLYTQKILSTTKYTSKLVPTGYKITKNVTDSIGFYIDNTNKILKVPSNYKIDNNTLWYIYDSSHVKFAYITIIKQIKEITELPSNYVDLPHTINNKQWYDKVYGISYQSGESITYTSQFSDSFTKQLQPFGNKTSYPNQKTQQLESQPDSAWFIHDFYLSEIPSPPPTPTVPNQPSNLTGIYDNINKRIKFTWKDNSSNEDGFKLIVKNNSGSTIASPVLTKNTSVYYVNNIQQNTGKYTAYVYQYNSVGSSTISNTYIVDTSVFTPIQINPPSNLSQIDIGINYVVLSWKDNSSNETNFKINLKDSNKHLIKSYNVGVNVTTLKITELAENRVYYANVYQYKDSTQNKSSSTPDISFRTKQTQTISPHLSINIGEIQNNIITEGTDYILTTKVYATSGRYSIFISNVTSGTTIYEKNHYNKFIKGSSLFDLKPNDEIKLNVNYYNAENNSKSYPLNILFQLKDQSTGKIVYQQTKHYTFKGVYIPSPPPPPPPVIGTFTLSCQNQLIGNQTNPIKYNNTYANAYNLVVYFIKNGQALNKKVLTINGNNSGIIYLSTPNSMSGITGIKGEIWTKNTSSGTPNSELLDTYTISQSQFNIISSIPTSLVINLPSTIKNNEQTTLKYNVKGSGKYKLLFSTNNVDTRYTTVTFSKTSITNINQVQSGSINITINSHLDLPRSFAITATLINMGNNEIEKTITKSITVEPVQLPYYLQQTISPQDNVNEDNPIYITVNKQTAPGNAKIKITQSVFKYQSEQTQTFTKIITNKTFKFIAIVPINTISVGSPIPNSFTNTFTIQLLDNNGNIQKTQTISIQVNHNINSINPINPINPVNPIYSNTSNYFITTYKSLGQDNNTIKQTLSLQIDDGQLVYINGNKAYTGLENHGSQKYWNETRDVSKYIKLGQNRIQIQVNNGINNIGGGPGYFDQELVVNSKIIIEKGSYWYYLTSEKIKSKQQVKSIMYQINVNSYNTNYTGNDIYELLQMKNQQIKTIVNKYEYIPIQKSSDPITINISPNVTKAIIYYGNNNNLKSYTHFYKNAITSNITIYSEQKPNNVTTLNNPFVVNTYINWGDRTTTTLTTSKDKNDIGTYNVNKLDYYIPQSDDQTILLKGTVKYLILGKTI